MWQERSNCINICPCEIVRHLLNCALNLILTKSYHLFFLKNLMMRNHCLSAGSWYYLKLLKSLAKKWPLILSFIFQIALGEKQWLQDLVTIYQLSKMSFLFGGREISHSTALFQGHLLRVSIYLQVLMDLEHQWVARSYLVIQNWVCSCVI